MLIHGSFGSAAHAMWYTPLEAAWGGPAEVVVLTPGADARTAVLAELEQRGLAPAAEQVASWTSYLWAELQRRWPSWAAQHGFDAMRPPIYLSFEQAQVVMDAVARPMRETGQFDGWALAPASLAAELLDVRAHAASATLSSERLAASWTEETPVQEALAAFADRCRRFNLIDFATLAGTAALGAPPDALVFAYRVDEWPPVALQMLSRWMHGGTACIAIADPHGGTRFRLGVDARFTATWRKQVADVKSADPNPTARGRLADEIVRLMADPDGTPHPDATHALRGHLTDRKRPRLFRAVAGAVRSALNLGTVPEDIALIAPYIDGASQVLLADAFDRAQIPMAFARRQQRLTASADVRAVRTVCALLAPDAFAPPHPDDLALTLHRLVPYLDLLRARLLVDLLFEPESGVLRDTSVLRKKDTVRLSERQHTDYNTLLYRLRPRSGEVTLTGLLDAAIAAFPDTYHAGPSVQSLRDAAARFLDLADALGVPERYRLQRFFDTLDAGFLAPATRGTPSGQVIAYSIDGFLREERAVAVQVWLDVQAPAWMPTPYAAFMNRATLSASWLGDAGWEASDERAWRYDQAARRVRSLLDRCTDGVYVCSHRDPQATLAPTPFLHALHTIAEAPR
ncbi:MAG: hypothetical protein AAF730_12780 [Bacteroidota bacterium]